MDFVCIQCGRRQAAGERCTACGEDNLLDLGKEQTRELLLDINQRLHDKRAARIRILGVVIGIAVVVMLWGVPGYWGFRNRTFALPFFLDQVALMIAIAFGATKLLEQVWVGRPKFPFIDGTGTLLD
jgi:hypothetical protein